MSCNDCDNKTDNTCCHETIKTDAQTPRHIISNDDEYAQQRAYLHCQMMQSALYGTLVEVRHD